VVGVIIPYQDFISGQQGNYRTNTIGGGLLNTICTTGVGKGILYSGNNTISGGYYNLLVNSRFSYVGGGRGNCVQVGDNRNYWWWTL